MSLKTSASALGVLMLLSICPQIGFSQGLWVTNTDGAATTANSVTEFTGKQLQKSDTPSYAAINKSASLAYPQKVLFDARGDMWVTNCPSAFGGSGDKITEFSANQVSKLSLPKDEAPSPTSIITNNSTFNSVVCPVGAAFDGRGNLWVANNGYFEATPLPNNIAVFNPSALSTGGQAEPSKILNVDGTGSLFSPGEIRFDASGNLWIADWLAVEKYDASQLSSLTDQTPGPTPQLTIIDPVNIDGAYTLAFDPEGNLWVASCTDNATAESTGDRLVEYAAKDLKGSGKITPAPRVVILASLSEPTPSLYCPNGMAFDDSGDLWVTNYLNGTLGSIVEYTPKQLAKSGNPTPAVTLNPTDGGGNFGGPFLISFGPSVK